LIFFKHEAAKHQAQYQRMMRRLLDSYVAALSGDGVCATRVTAAAVKTMAVGT
jgi:hypothetical protein